MIGLQELPQVGQLEGPEYLQESNDGADERTPTIIRHDIGLLADGEALTDWM